MKNRYSSFYSIDIALVFLFVFVSACSTGIENTKTIKMTRAEQKITQETEEDRIMKDFRAPLISQWEVGKPFLVADNRANLVFDAAGRNNIDSQLEGDTLLFKGVASKTTPVGTEEMVVIFTDGSNDYRYVTGKTPEAALNSLSSMDIPMLIDLDLVKKTADVLKGKRLWTRTLTWYDSRGEKFRGRQFVPVVIEDVQPGNMVFPLKVYIKDETGRDAMLYMNIKNSGIESRSFPSLFYVSDPKLRYSSVLPEVWEYIRDGRVKNGMTKEECKLALGNPSDVNAGHDWNSTIEFWQYPDGKFLRFEDGLLIDYRN